MNFLVNFKQFFNKYFNFKQMYRRNKYLNIVINMDKTFYMCNCLYTYDREERNQILTANGFEFVDTSNENVDIYQHKDYLSVFLIYNIRTSEENEKKEENNENN